MEVIEIAQDMEVAYSTGMVVDYRTAAGCYTADMALDSWLASLLLHLFIIVYICGDAEKSIE